MGMRGRRSAAALSVVGPSGLEAVRRPEPLPELTDEQAEEWRRVVSMMAADWFPPETHALLAQYCRHVVSARKVAQLIEAEEAQSSLDVEAYERLLKMQDREGKALSSLATRMRLSQQSSYDRKVVKAAKFINRPWDADAR